MTAGHTVEPGDIIIKDVEILRGLMERRFSPLLITIICSIAEKFGLVMTESYREKRHMNDLHGVLPVRAVDLRSWCYVPESLAYEIMHWINQVWIYDPSRPDKKVAIIHRVNGGALHFHIQVHPNTVRRSYDA
ncbi:MAG: hypothetical protein MI862_23635 [Desulfobacterales bacterium]|nr:hypothetical protein [Desulfobacterales bacterium]